MLKPGSNRLLLASYIISLTVSYVIRMSSVVGVSGPKSVPLSGLEWALEPKQSDHKDMRPNRDCRNKGLQTIKKMN